MHALDFDCNRPEIPVHNRWSRKLLPVALLVLFTSLTLLTRSCGLQMPRPIRIIPGSMKGSPSSLLPAAILPSDRNWHMLTYYHKPGGHPIPRQTRNLGASRHFSWMLTSAGESVAGSGARPIPMLRG